MELATRAWGLPTLLDDAPPEASILSLDCFDTLLWRNMNLPADLFADLQMPGGGLEQRIWGETRARRVTPYKHNRVEVTIDEIYEHLMSSASSMQKRRTAMVLPRPVTSWSRPSGAA